MIPFFKPTALILFLAAVFCKLSFGNGDLLWVASSCERVIEGQTLRVEMRDPGHSSLPETQVSIFKEHHDGTKTPITSLRAQLDMDPENRPHDGHYSDFVSLPGEEPFFLRYFRDSNGVLRMNRFASGQAIAMQITKPENEIPSFFSELGYLPIERAHENIKPSRPGEVITVRFSPDETGAVFLERTTRKLGRVSQGSASSHQMYFTIRELTSGRILSEIDVGSPYREVTGVLGAQDRAFETVEYTPGGDQILVATTRDVAPASTRSALRVFLYPTQNKATLKSVTIPLGPNENVSGVRLLDDNTLLLALKNHFNNRRFGAHSTSRLAVYDIQNQTFTYFEARGALRKVNSEILALAHSKNGLIATFTAASGEAVVQVWNKSGKLVKTLPSLPRYLVFDRSGTSGHELKFSEDGSLLFLSGRYDVSYAVTEKTGGLYSAQWSITSSDLVRIEAKDVKGLDTKYHFMGRSDYRSISGRHLIHLSRNPKMSAENENDDPIVAFGSKPLSP